MAEKAKKKFIFVQSEYCLAQRRWSDKWEDSNGVKGSFFYIALNGNSETTDLPDGNQGVVIKKSVDGIEPDTIMLRITGGKAVADTLPEKVYMCVEEGSPRRFGLITLEKWEELTSVPTLDSDVELSQATADLN
tara:strand:+ start:100 stop:501 length:402 start_codon:yes stop_codon:yes gene_type:complete